MHGIVLGAMSMFLSTLHSFWKGIACTWMPEHMVVTQCGEVLMEDSGGSAGLQETGLHPATSVTEFGDSADYVGFMCVLRNKGNVSHSIP